MSDLEKTEETAEIEVTPEMVEAGLILLNAYDPEHDNGFDFVASLYRTMELERRLSKDHRSGP